MRAARAAKKSSASYQQRPEPFLRARDNPGRRANRNSSQREPYGPARDEAAERRRMQEELRRLGPMNRGKQEAEQRAYSEASIRRWAKPTKNPRRSPGYARRYNATKAVINGESMRPNKAKKKGHGKRGLTPKQIKAGFGGKAAQARALGRKSTSKGKRKAHARPFHRLSMKVGGKTRKTYMYRTKTGAVHHIPMYGSMGFRSKRDMARAMDPKVRPLTAAQSRVHERALKRYRGIIAARERAGKRTAIYGDLFTPNRPRRKARRSRAISYSEWSKNGMYTSNRPLSKAGRSKAAKKAAATRRRKAEKRSAAARKAAATRRRHAGKRKAAPRKIKTTRRAATKRKPRKSGKRRGRDSKGRFLKGHRVAKKSSAHRKPRAATKRRSGPKRGKNGRFKKNATGSFMMNRRRRHHGRRHHRLDATFRRNGTLGQALKDAAITGAVVGAGFFAHKALTKLIVNYLMTGTGPLASTFGTPTMAPYQDIIAGAVVAVAGIAIAEAVPSIRDTQAKNIAAGMVVSFLQKLVVDLLTNNSQAPAAAYLSGFGSYSSTYPNSGGRAYYTGPQGRIGGYGRLGEYFATSGFGGFAGNGGYRQAAAGFGSPMQAAAGYGSNILQASAGYGALPAPRQQTFTQAAAGMGEYFATGVEGFGEYFDTGTSGMSGMGSTDEGIQGGDSYAAEHALTVAEAAAGIGDIPMQSTVDAMQRGIHVQDSPTGSRSGTFQGRDGIFG